MVGLVFVDTLQLTVRQHAAILCNTAVCLYGYAKYASASKSNINTDLLFGAVCACTLWYGFYGIILTRDVQLLFQSASYLSEFPLLVFTMIFLGYGNIKYLIFVLFALPIENE